MDAEFTRRALIATAGLGTVAWMLTGSKRGETAVAFEVNRSPAQWRQLLGAERYAILRQGSTERAFTSPLNKEHRRGTFVCAGCALPLFASTTKYDSGTGWPSFYRALPKSVVTRADTMLGMKRTEVLCRRCGGHLGHVFRDGPKPTGLRFCMNGLALRFRPA